MNGLGFGGNVQVNPMQMSSWGAPGQMAQPNMGVVPLAGSLPGGGAGYNLGSPVGAAPAMPMAGSVAPAMAMNAIPSATDIGGITATPTAAAPAVTDAAGMGGNGFLRTADGGFNFDGLSALTTGLSTLGSLWNSWQQTKVAKDSLNFQKDAYNTNLANQTKDYNTTLEARTRAQYATEGRDEEADAYINRRKL